MTQRILSQQEVDALMSGIAAGEISTETDASRDKAGVRPYDLTSQERVVRGRMPTMEIVNEQFCRRFRLSLFNFIGKICEVNVEGTKLVKYSEFISRLPLPTSLNIFRLSPLNGLNLLVFDANFIFNILDSYYGGSGKYPMYVEGREFSAVEQKVIRKLIDMVFEDMEKSWMPVVSLKFEYRRSEMNPQFANIVSPSEIIIASVFTIEIDGKTSKVSVCLPYSNIEPIKEKLYATYQSDSMAIDRTWNMRLETDIKNTIVNTTCILGEGSLTINDFLQLDVGDIVMLNKKTAEPALFMVEGISKFTCTTGRYNNHYAVQINKFLSKEGGFGYENTGYANRG
ncbi:MAG: flagellar motor switch protein FliM [Deltaproteobacteria bacterium]|nr:flagellar motor switch protein FliM [Deltaproteobacteria bacterium]